METIDEVREKVKKKKCHQPPCLPFLASPLPSLKGIVLKPPCFVFLGDPSSSAGAAAAMTDAIRPYRTSYGY